MARRRIRDRLLLALALSADMVQDFAVESSYAYRYGKLLPWTPPGYQRRQLYNTVKRLLRTDMFEKEIVDGKPIVTFGKSGKKLFQTQINLIKWQKNDWQGRWCLVFFDFPVKLNSKRNWLRAKIKTLGFGKWQRSLYISPHDFTKKINSYLEDYNIKGMVWTLSARLKNLSESRLIANKVWHLEDRNKKYFDLLQKVKNNKKARKSQYEKYLNLIEDDPFLPISLLPRPWWEFELRKILTG